MITQEPIGHATTIAIPRRPNAGGIRRAASIVAAIVAAAITWLALTNLANVALKVPSYGGTAKISALGLGQVMITTLIAGLLAWGVLTAVGRFSRNARRLWGDCGACSAGRLVTPTADGTITWRGAATLPVVFHIVVATVLILTLRATLPPTERRAGENR